MSRRMCALAGCAGAALVAAGLAGCGGAATGPKPPLDGDQRPTAAARLEDLRGDLVSVDIVGMPAERSAAARSALHSAVGAKFDRSQVAADVRALWALGSLTDVRAEGRLVQGGVALRYAVREQPRIRSVDVVGSSAVPRDQWLAQMPVKAGDFVDPVRLGSIRRTMLDRLREVGFHTVKVEWKSTDAKGAGADVVFTIEEGRLVSLAAIELRGNKVVSQKTLLSILAREGTTVGARYWRRALERGLFHLGAHYYDLGHVNISVGQVEETLSTDGSQMSIVIPVSEGAQFRLGGLEFKGALVAPARQYESVFGLRRGQVFSRRKVGEGLEKLRELHRSKGQPRADVLPVTEVDEKKKRINLTIQVVQADAAGSPAVGTMPSPEPGARATPSAAPSSPAPGAGPGAAPSSPAPGAGSGAAPSSPAPGAGSGAAPSSPAPGAAPARPAAPPAAPAPTTPNPATPAPTKK